MRKHIKNLFLPHEGNGFKPNILERISLGIMFALILFSFALANIQSLLWISSDFLVSTILPAVIVELTNEEREDQTLGDLVRNPTLDAAANAKAQHMADNEYFAHYSPDGISPWHWFDQESYVYLHAGENLAVHFTDSDDVVKGWMDSPSHRANILNGDFTEIGVGTAQGEYKGFPTVFVVQLFGTRQAIASEPGENLTLETTTESPEVVAPVEEVAQASIEAIPEEELVDPVVEEIPIPIEIEADEPKTEDGEEQVSETEVAEEPIEEAERVVIFSDLATTSRSGVPAVIDPSDGGGSSEAGILAKSALQPSLWLQVIYGLLALVVIVALILSIAIEWRRQHPVQIAYAGGMLAMMAVLFYAHTILTGGVTII